MSLFCLHCDMSAMSSEVTGLITILCLRSGLSFKMAVFVKFTLTTPIITSE